MAVVVGHRAGPPRVICVLVGTADESRRGSRNQSRDRVGGWRRSSWWIIAFIPRPRRNCCDAGVTPSCVFSCRSSRRERTKRRFSRKRSPPLQSSRRSEAPAIRAKHTSAPNPSGSFGDRCRSPRPNRSQARSDPNLRRYIHRSQPCLLRLRGFGSNE